MDSSSRYSSGCQVQVNPQSFQGFKWLSVQWYEWFLFGCDKQRQVDVKLSLGQSQAWLGSEGARKEFK